jgi:hypothetical protein
MTNEWPELPDGMDQHRFTEDDLIVMSPPLVTWLDVGDRGRDDYSLALNLDESLMFLMWVSTVESGAQGARFSSMMQLMGELMALPLPSLRGIRGAHVEHMWAQGGNQQGMGWITVDARLVVPTHYGH